MDAEESFDVVVVGAGLSGIAAGYHLGNACPGRRYVILESRQAIGGTWDLFRYPGVRSDSDMYTLGYSFRPWNDNASFAAGPAIRDYVTATAREFGIDRHIRFGHRVTGAAWDSAQARWTVEVSTAQGARRLSCRFLFFCSGYYDYERGHDPEFEGRDVFQGPIVHPQHWPAGLDYEGRRVVIIGSGATAVTLVPQMAQRAAHVTMLQRSPTYILALPGQDGIAAAWRRWLPAATAHTLIRWKNILLSMAIYQYSRRRPQAVARFIRRSASRLAGPGLDVERHLKPAYDPWDQRLCIAPDADLFRAIREGKADIVTGAIERLTPTGVRLASGEELPADLIVTATGLKLKIAGGAQLRVDGRPVDLAQSFSYRGAMFSGVPNCAAATGYTNASWTLKCELIARYVCRLLNHLERTGQDICMPAPPEPGSVQARPAIDLSSGYVQRGAGLLPRQGDRKPWRVHQNYLRDLMLLKFTRLRDGAMRFGPRGRLPGGPA